MDDKSEVSKNIQKLHYFLKGVYSKPSSKYIVGPDFFFELETSNFGYLLIF